MEESSRERRLNPRKNYTHNKRRETLRSVQTEMIGDNLYRILPTKDYEPKDAGGSFLQAALSTAKNANIIKNTILKLSKNWLNSPSDLKRITDANDRFWSGEWVAVDF